MPAQKMMCVPHQAETTTPHPRRLKEGRVEVDQAAAAVVAAAAAVVAAAAPAVAAAAATVLPRLTFMAFFMAFIVFMQNGQSLIALCQSCSQGWLAGCMAGSA